MNKIKPGIAARVTAGDLVGKVGFVTAFSSTLGTATIEIDDLTYQISAEYLDQSKSLQQKKIIVGAPARITAGIREGEIGVITSVSPTLARAVIEFDDGTILHTPVDYLDQGESVTKEKEQGYHEWIRSLPDPQQWLEYQISEYNARFEGVNLLNVFGKDDDYKTLVMLRNTLAALKSARSNEEYYKREYQKERSENSWAKNPDRMGQ